MPTLDIERLNESLKREIRELMDLTVSGDDYGGGHVLENGRSSRPAPPMGDPGTGTGFHRRSQAQHDREFWLRQRDRLLDRLGTLMAEGKVTL